MIAHSALVPGKNPTQLHQVNLASSLSNFHVTSRIVDREFKMGRVEKEKFVELMRVYEGLSGLRVLSYCVMSNHFHILVEVPKRPEPEDLPDDAGLVARVREWLGDKMADGLAWELKHLRSIGGDSGGDSGEDSGVGGATAAEELRERWFARMWDISSFMKALKQRFTRWYNRKHERTGTLWESRFHSVLVQGAAQALRTMAAYIDLNPVRAGICEDPKDYRWSGYGEAVAGGKQASEALCCLASLSRDGGQRSETLEGMEGMEREESLRRWRCTLFGVPEGEGSQAEELKKEASRENGAELFRKGVSRAKALEVLAKGGRLSRADYLRCRIRYFSAGAAIGTREFVEEMFEAKREWFSEGRKTGARPLRGLEFGDKSDRLFSFRQLKKDVFG